MEQNGWKYIGIASQRCINVLESDGVGEGQNILVTYC